MNRIKLVYNDCYGGFCLSEDAIVWLQEKTKKPITKHSYYDSKYRYDKYLVECVELFGVNASGEHAALKVIEGPELPCTYSIIGYAGREFVEFTVNKK